MCASVRDSVPIFMQVLKKRVIKEHKGLALFEYYAISFW